MSTPDAHENPGLPHLDAYASVRAHPEWFFRSGAFSVPEMISLLTHEALTHGATDLATRAIGDWWLIWSEHDWLDGDLAAFLTLAADPTAGPNSVRVEFLLTAHCRSVWTAHGGTAHDVTASGGLPTDVQHHLESIAAGRAIAFLPPEAESPLPTTCRRHLNAVPDSDLTGKFDELLAQLQDKTVAFDLPRKHV